MASRRLEDLHPSIQPLAARLIVECRKAGIDLLIYCTYRSPAEQAELWELGRSKPGRKVTWTRRSKHNNEANGKPAALAFDCVPLVGGKAAWDDDALYEEVGQIGMRIGLTWGGRWKGKCDKPHFEL